MQKPWLELKSYGLVLFMARDLLGKGKHTLVMTGPRVGENTQALASLGFAFDGRFPGRNYWVRSIEGMSHRKILEAFPQGVLVEMPVERIMPALKQAMSANKATSKEKRDGTELTDARSVSSTCPWKRRCCQSWRGCRFGAEQRTS
ncbi:hypothetical protein SSTU70S_05753 [Stutzerimonas stutzeri]